MSTRPPASRPDPAPPAAGSSTGRPPGAVAPPARAGAVKRHLRLAGFLVPLVVVLLAAAYFALALRFSYSSGDRAGYVQKFSKKGWVCKTWEGELAMVSLPGTAPEVFRFSVRDDGVARQINQHLGARVALTYEQHMGLPRCFAETEYYVTGVRRVE